MREGRGHDQRVITVSCPRGLRSSYDNGHVSYDRWLRVSASITTAPEERVVRTPVADTEATDGALLINQRSH